jgi:epsilon-lactone hydrolase
LVSEIIKNAHISALMIEYRRAPESPFPAALEDAVESYKYLLAQGYKPENIAIGGDSAGGGLAVATLLFLKNNQIPLPKCSILLCPWVDLTFHFPSIERLDESDCIIDVKELKYRADLYIGKAEVKNPYISPYFGDLSGLPDTYVQTAEEDVLVDEGVAFAEKAQKAGVKVEVETEKRAFHVYQAFWNFVPAGKKANQRLGAYLRRKLC